MSEEELIDMLYSKFCNENDDYDIRYTDIIYNSIEEKDKQLDKYKLILKALHKHFTEHEEYENNEFLRQLENCNENDMIWLKRMAGEKNEFLQNMSRRNKC